MPEELMFTIDPHDKRRATSLPATGLAAMQYTERDLQEWVLANPEILGDDAVVIAAEVGTWQSAEGVLVRDRLDILALGTDGRLIVAELKRGQAPHTVHMQALNYASMVSSLSVGDVAALYVARQKHLGETAKAEDLVEVLETRYLVTSATLRDPRVVLIASSFPPVVTSTTVWLKERGVDISLVRFIPYEFADGTRAVSFSRFFPIPTLDDLKISFDSTGSTEGPVATTDAPWDIEGLQRLAAQGNVATLTLLDLLAESEDSPVSSADVMGASGLSTGQFRGQLAGLTMRLKNGTYGFSQTSAPWDVTWLAGGFASYTLTPDLAAIWRRIRSSNEETAPTLGNESPLVEGDTSGTFEDEAGKST